MTNEQLNKLLEIEHQKRMGDLYEDLRCLVIEQQVHESVQLCALVRLVQQYGTDNVSWMLDVIRQDMAC